MRIQSPLSNLSDVLTQVRESAQRYQPTLKKNEASTRAVLIDPVLRALGWDTANTYMVEIEKTLDQSRVDYALYDSNGTVRIIIEAKPLGMNLGQAGFIMSLVNYAFTFQLQDIFLTDGMIWQHFTNFQPGNVKVERTLDLKNDDVVNCAAYLVQRLDAAKFWPDDQTIDQLAQQIGQLESLVATLQRDIELLKQDRTPSVPTIKSLPKQPASMSSTLISQAQQPNHFVPISSIGDVTGSKPIAYRLPDGTEITVKTWKDVLRESCKYVLARNPDLPIPFPDRSGKKVSLFSTSKPASGLSFVTDEYRGQTIYIYVNYDANNCISNSKYILEYLPADHKDIAIPSLVLSKNVNK